MSIENLNKCVKETGVRKPRNLKFGTRLGVGLIRMQKPKNIKSDTRITRGMMD